MHLKYGMFKLDQLKSRILLQLEKEGLIDRISDSVMSGSVISQDSPDSWLRTSQYSPRTFALKAGHFVEPNKDLDSGQFDLF